MIRSFSNYAGITSPRLPYTVSHTFFALTAAAAAAAADRPTPHCFTST